MNSRSVAVAYNDQSYRAVVSPKEHTGRIPKRPDTYRAGPYSNGGEYGPASVEPWVKRGIISPPLAFGIC